VVFFQPHKKYVVHVATKKVFVFIITNLLALIMSTFSTPTRSDDGDSIFFYFDHPFSFLSSGSTSSLSHSAGGGSGNRRRSGQKQPKTGPLVIKGKLYFHAKEEVPLLVPPAGVDLSGLKFFINNQTGLKTLYNTKHEAATDGVGLGILRSTTAGKVYVDTNVVDEESEIFLGIRLTLDELRAMFATKPKDEETESAIVGVDALDLKDEN
jgi:hypothetical protein